MTTATRPGVTLAAALSALVAAAPLRTLLRTNRWFEAAVVAVVLVALVGVVGRSRRLTPLGVATLQLLAGLLGLTLVLRLGSGPFGLPGLDALSRTAALLGEGLDTIRRYAAPAPETRGLGALLAVVTCVVAVLVDHLAVGRRAPAAAGFPLLTVFLVAAVNTGTALPWPYFFGTAVLWLFLVASESVRSIRMFSSTTAQRAGAPLEEHDTATERFGTRTRLVAVAAVALSLAVQALLPQTGTRFLTDGLGRGGNHDRPGLTSFGSDVDVTRDLRSRSPEPVLAVTTNDPQLGPLSVSVAGTYENGRWKADAPGESVPLGDSSDALPLREVSGTTAPTARRSVTITKNLVKAPQLAAPGWPVRHRGDATVQRSDHGLLTIDRQVEEYTVDYLDIAPRASDLDAPMPADPPVRAETRDVPLPRGSLVASTARAVVARAPKTAGRPESPFTKALALQTYLRSDPFTYSLELAPAPQGVDPVSAFLQSKRGYCVQFSTAMALMARSLGIPARVRMGYLSGSPTPGTVATIRRADAHMWPELYLPGTGWTRFEPTPGDRSGLPPAYATPATPTTPTPTAAPSDPGATVTPTRPADRETDDPEADATPADGSSGPRPWLWWALGILGAVCAALAAAPVAAWASRRRRLAAASSPEETVEARWEILREQLDDLGVALPTAGSPAVARQHLSQDPFLGREARDRLVAALHQVERARYARPGGSLEPLDDAGLAALVGRNRSWRRRVRAALLPSAGRAELSRVVRSLASRSR